MITSIPRAAASAISATLVDPVSTVTMSAIPVAGRRLDRGRRQAVALLEAARDVGHRVEPEAPERQHELGEPGQAVGIEVAEHHDPLAAVDGAADRARPGGRRRAAGGGRSGRPRPGRGSAPWPPASAIPRRARTVAAKVPEAERAGRGPDLGIEMEGLREDPAVTRVDHRREDAMSGLAGIARAGRPASRPRRRRPGPDHVAGRRLGRAASSASRRLSSRRCQTTSSGPR